MSIPYDLTKFSDDIEFDENKWNDLINSDEIFNEQISKSIENSDVCIHKKDIIKLSSDDLKRSTFIYTNKFYQLNRTLTILIPPSPYQRVRYENECKKIFRYISVPNNRTMTIAIPDLRDVLMGDKLWMRITRTTIDHRKDGLIFYHPYPIWIRNEYAKIHQGSVFISIRDYDMTNGFIQIFNLAMIRLKQDELSKINTLAIYSATQLDSCDLHSIETKTPKRIRDIYKLRQSTLNFQLVRVDQNNIAYPTDCLCQTEILQEFEANEQKSIVTFRKIKKTKTKKSVKRKKI